MIPLLKISRTLPLWKNANAFAIGFVPSNNGTDQPGGFPSLSRMRVINSHGTDLSTRSSVYSFGAEILYPGSYASIGRQVADTKFKTTPEDTIDFISSLYNQSLKEAQPRGGEMNVLFLPEALYVLMWRLQSATNGRNIYQKVSPVLDKRGEKILDEKFTLYDDPLNDRDA